MRTTKRTVLAALALALGSLQAAAQADRSFEIAKNLEIFSSVYKQLNLNYVDDVDPGKTIKVAIDAMLSSLDPYTNYYPESDIEDVKLQLLGEYGGVGALIMQRGDSIIVSEPYKGLPADEAGIKAGDLILEVNGESTRGKKTADVSSAMRGQAGTQVTLKLERAGKVFEKALTRREIKLPNVPYYGYVQGDYGYIKLDEFTTDAAKNVKEAFLKLRQDKPGMKGIILDLRGNGGGLMNEAVDIVNLWVPQGTLVVETKGKVASKNMKSYTRMQPVDTKIPVAVIIDNTSASASEIVSGALQDLDRAVVIGQRSYGKGLVQNILPMPYNSQMKVTVSKYYIPSGRCIQAIDYSHRDEQGRRAGARRQGTRLAKDRLQDQERPDGVRRFRHRARRGGRARLHVEPRHGTGTEDAHLRLCHRLLPQPQGTAAGLGVRNLGRALRRLLRLPQTPRVDLQHHYRTRHQTAARRGQAGEICRRHRDATQSNGAATGARKGRRPAETPLRGVRYAQGRAAQPLLL